MTRVRIGQRVRLADPAQIAARFWDAARKGVVGDEGRLVPRELLDREGVVVRLGLSRKADRGLIDFGPSAHVGPITTAMWLQADVLEPAEVEEREPAQADQQAVLL